MIYLDNGATSFPKPQPVVNAMVCAMENCGNPGRGGYKAAMTAAKTVLRCREQAAELFACQPEQVVMTSNCTHGLNIAIRTLVKPGNRVLISGFEHNAVMRPLYLLGADVKVVRSPLFDDDSLIQGFAKELHGAKAAVCTAMSNVFGYITSMRTIHNLNRYN